MVCHCQQLGCATMLCYVDRGRMAVWLCVIQSGVGYFIHFIHFILLMTPWDCLACQIISKSYSLRNFEESGANVRDKGVMQFFFRFLPFFEIFISYYFMSPIKYHFFIWCRWCTPPNQRHSDSMAAMAEYAAERFLSVGAVEYVYVYNRYNHIYNVKQRFTTIPSYLIIPSKRKPACVCASVCNIWFGCNLVVLLLLLFLALWAFGWDLPLLLSKINGMQWILSNSCTRSHEWTPHTHIRLQMSCVFGRCIGLGGVQEIGYWPMQTDECFGRRPMAACVWVYMMSTIFYWRGLKPGKPGVIY